MLLLDEPLSALDTHTRAGVRAELRELLEALRLPTVVVTHDFEDAAMLAHRVGVISEGRILQTRDAGRSWSATPDDRSSPFHWRNAASRAGGRGAERPDRVALEGGLTVWSADRASRAGERRGLPVGRRGRACRAGGLAHEPRAAPVLSLAPMGNRVRVRIGPVVAEITAASAERLALRTGMVVTASFKATETRLFKR